MHSMRILLTSLLAACVLCADERPIPVILDTDIGDDIDDALALSFALQSPELKLLAVTTVLQDREGRASLVWKILSLYGRTDIPVGAGAEQPFIAPARTGKVRQVEALGPLDHIPPGQMRGGIQLIVDTCLNASGKVTILAIGPATNVALALRAEPRIKEKIERIVLMNGLFFKPGLEYNTRSDPEASAIVYGSGVPVTAVGLDVTMQCKLTAADMPRIEQSRLPSAQFLYKLIRIWNSGNDDKLPVLHDPLAVGVTFRPGLVSVAAGSVEVETRGEPNRTYGMTVLRRDASGNIRVAEEVSSREFIELFLDRVLETPRK
jgi:purine nucleosidase/pyrimidine-specific ribonucleoside hydrolase